VAKKTKKQATPELPESRYDLRVLQALRRIMRATDVHSRRLRSTYALTTPQLLCLLAVADDGPLTATKIADRVFLSPSTVVGILDRLEARELIQRQRDTNDRRMVNVSATGKGLQLAREAPNPLQESLARRFKELSRDAQARIADSLEEVAGLMQAEELDVSPVLSAGPLNGSTSDNDPSPS